MPAATVLVVLSAAIVLVLGTIHLIYTFIGVKLHPRDPELRARMEAVSPVITRETTMWKTWIGFNASHSYGAMLFGVVYGYLAIARPDVLFGSVFLGVVGGVFLVGMLVLARRYFFSIPFRGVVVAVVCYGAGFVVAWSR